MLVRVTERIAEPVRETRAARLANRVSRLLRPPKLPPLPPDLPLLYQHLYFDEDGSDRNGIWTGDTFHIPVPAEAPLLLSFKAFNPESLFIRAEDAWGQPHGETVLRFRLGGSELASYTLDGEGDFTLDLPLGKAGPPVGVLDVSVSRHFTPEVVYGSPDRRRLSLLLKRVVVDGLVVIDSTAAPLDRAPVEALVAQPPGLVVVGYVKAEMGLGESARSCIRSAQAAGLAVSVKDVGFQAMHRQEGGEGEAADGPPMPVAVLHVNAEKTRDIRHYLAEQPHPPGYTIGFWHWEQPDFPTDYLPCFEGLDEIWTPSSFVQAAISAVAPVPVLRMPHAVVAAASPGASRAAFGLPERVFLALVTYDFYSYQHRKNPQAAIAAVRLAAASGVRVGLVVKTINGDSVPEALAELRQQLQDLPDVVLIDRYLGRQEMFDLQACCDCLISLHRAEGFGLNLAEMMCLGKPVIATAWSGNTDFMTRRNALPVDYVLQPLAHPVGPYRAGLMWAEADPEHAAVQLARLVADPALGERLGRQAQADMQACYTPAAVGRLYRRRLSLLKLTGRVRASAPGP